MKKEKCTYCREYGNLPCEKCDKQDKTKIYLDLSKLSGEEIKTVIEITNISDEYLKYAPYLIFLNDKWITSNGGYIHKAKLTEINLSEFRQLFSGEEVLQVEKPKASSFILGQIDKKIEQINEIDIAHTEGVLVGLNICKQLWAQGTISHENIREEIYHYQEELENLKSNK